MKDAYFVVYVGMFVGGRIPDAGSLLEIAVKKVCIILTELSEEVFLSKRMDGQYGFTSLLIFRKR